MIKDRMEEIEEHILKIDEDDSTNRSKMLDYRHWAYELLKIASEQAERTKELESFKNSVEYTVDTETIELIVENQDSDVALSSVETYDEEIYFLKKRVEELIKAHELKELEHQGLISQLKEKDNQNKRYRDFIKTISNPWEIARKIGKETDKNIIRADEVVGWIEREAEKILREE